METSLLCICIVRVHVYLFRAEHCIGAVWKLLKLLVPRTSTIYSEALSLHELPIFVATNL